MRTYRLALDAAVEPGTGEQSKRDGVGMETQTTYKHLVQRSDKQAQELFIRGRGVRASTIWHDRYVSCTPPDRIASDRELPLEAVLEALAY